MLGKPIEIRELTALRFLDVRAGRCPMLLILFYRFHLISKFNFDSYLSSRFSDYVIGVLAGCLMLFITILVVIMLGIGKSSSHGSEEHSDTRLINVYNIFYVSLSRRLQTENLKNFVKTMHIDYAI